MSMYAGTAMYAIDSGGRIEDPNATLVRISELLRFERVDNFGRQR